MSLATKQANRTGIYAPTKPGFFVKESTLTDGSKTYDVWIQRNDGQCLVLCDTCISERHANAVCDALNAALDIHGVV